MELFKDTLKNVGSVIETLFFHTNKHLLAFHVDLT